MCFHRQFSLACSFNRILFCVLPPHLITSIAWNFLAMACHCHSPHFCYLRQFKFHLISCITSNTVFFSLELHYFDIVLVCDIVIRTISNASVTAVTNTTVSFYITIYRANECFFLAFTSFYLPPSLLKLHLMFSSILCCVTLKSMAKTLYWYWRGWSF